ncbi:MAG: phenylalanine 4-monooxygenase [Sphingomonadales bacterium]
MEITTALGRVVEVNDDYTVDQGWDDYTQAEHDRWDLLYARQGKVLKGRACNEFMEGVEKLEISKGGIPNFLELSERLGKMTGWSIVAVPDLVPDEVFFEHLANRRFPAALFIRSAEQLDYLQEPDIFHDVFGHAPMLAHPVFADYMEAYGKGGLRADGLGVLHKLARLYWYTVEFGLIHTSEGLRIFGSGIVSSKGESIYSLEDPSPNRIDFELLRVMSTNYRIDDYQETYFVIDSFEALADETLKDFASIYKALEGRPEMQPADIVDGDVVVHRGSQAYEAARIKERAQLAKSTA